MQVLPTPTFQFNFNLFIKHDRSLHKLVRQGTNKNKINVLLLQYWNRLTRDIVTYLQKGQSMSHRANRLTIRS